MRARAGCERGQSTVEWVGLVLLVCLLLAAALAALGVRVPAAELARTLAARLLCAASLSGGCGTDDELASAYGPELAELVRAHAPNIAYEVGSRAMPTDFRRCRSPACANGDGSVLTWRAAGGGRVVAFVHVVDCRERDRAGLGADCSGTRAGGLYLQYWLYYPDSATLRGVPVVGERGFHRDDWESYQVRVGPGGGRSRASSHHGHNYEQGARNWGADAGIGPLRDAAEAAGLREQGGWGPETGWLFVSGGSHAGNANGNPLRIGRVTPARRLRLVPLEPVAQAAGAGGFSVVPPWAKRVWWDPEEVGTE